MSYSVLIIVLLLLGFIYFKFFASPTKIKKIGLGEGKQGRVEKVNQVLKNTLSNSLQSNEANKPKTRITPIPDDFLLFHLTALPTSQDAKKLSYSLSEISRPHPLLSKLCGPLVSQKELQHVIKQDPELVAKVINSANSPLFGLKKPIMNINHGITFLGLIQVQSIATQFALKQAITFKQQAQERAYQKIWFAGFLASSISLEFSNAFSLENAGELSTVCQLSYLGDLAAIVEKPSIAQLYISESDVFLRTRLIQKHFNAHQGILASVLAKKWDLPSKLTTVLPAVILPLTNSHIKDNNSALCTVELIICYISCRLAELIAIDVGLDALNYKSLSWDDSGRVEFFYTEQHLTDNNLKKLNKVYTSTEFKLKISQLFEGL